METLGKDHSWTNAYERWDTWKDPEDEATQKREAERKSLQKNFRKNNMSCDHDRSAERKLMDMSIEEKIKACREFRHKGNMFHGEGQYRRAALQYRQALIYYDFCFPEENSEQQELDEIRKACLLNSAACFLACRELDQTLDCCYQALREDPENAKALYRRAVVHRMRDQFEEASTDLAKALAQLPNDIALRKENAILKSKIASYRARSKVMGERIFRTGQQEDPREATSPSDAPVSSTFYGDDIVENAFESSTKSGEDVEAKVGRDGIYAVAGEVPAEASEVDCGAGSEEDKRRKQHGLLLPVCVDLSQVERIAGCSWPDVCKS